MAVDLTNLKLEAISVHRPKYKEGYCRIKQTRNTKDGCFKWGQYKIMKLKKKKIRTIAMYKCKKCRYHFGTPHHISDNKSKEWKPKKCSACGSKEFKFYKFKKLR